MNKQEFEEVKLRFAKGSLERKLSKYLNFGSLLLSIAGVFYTFIYFSTDVYIAGDFYQSKDFKTLSQIEKLKGELEVSKKLNVQLLNRQKNQSFNIDDNTQFAKLQKEVEILNNVILNSPEKAISIPLLKIEIENIQKQNDKEFNSIKNDVTRVYDMNKWIIGLVFTMLVSIIVLNISNLFAKNNKTD